MKQVVYDLNKDGERLLLEGKYLWQQGNPDVAIQKFQRAVEYFRDAINSLEPNPEHKNPEAAWSYAHLGEAQRLVGDDSAKDSFEAAIDRSKMSGKKNPYAQAHLGEYYRSSTLNTPKNLRKARECFTQAIGKSSEAPYLWAYAHRGAAHDFDVADVDEIKEALEDFDKAITESGDTYAWALAFRSVVYLYKLHQEDRPEEIRTIAMKAWKDLLLALWLDSTIIDPHSDVVRRLTE